MRVPRIFVYLPVLLLAALPAGAQIYKVTEGDSVEFTDRPAAPESGRKVEKVDLPDTNRTPAVDPTEPTRERAEEEPSAAAATEVRILSPDDEATIAMGPGNFDVAAATSPPLGRDEALQLLMDGQPQGTPQRSANWRIEGAMRGEHRLEVVRMVTGEAGEPLARSEPVTVYVLRPSVINRR